MLLERILIPVDFSEVSLQALDYAVELGKPFGAQLLVLYVVEPIYYATPADLYGPSVNLGMLVDEQQQAARAQLTELQTQLYNRDVKAETLVDSGVPYQKIVQTAEQRKADLIVMATHGRTGFSHLLLGSVTERVVRAAKCPVLTVRGYEGGQPTS
jgi:nucleotide-binding universal stress UspA family protein